MNSTTELGLSATICRYLALKQALGRGGTLERRVLQTVEAFMADTGAADLTQSEFEHWCRTQLHVSPTVRRCRMRIVRNFCLYRRRTEPHCFVPDLDCFPSPHQPVQPHIFSEAEIVQLLQAAAQLRPGPRSPLRPQVFRLAIVLLYTTGLRRGELARLTLQDYDPHARTLRVQASKFHKSRYLPLSADGSREIDVFLQARRKHPPPMRADAALLCNGYRNGYTGSGLWQGIRELLRVSGVRTADGRLPRVHDFRHGFAVEALLRWYRAGVDLQAKLPMLATYMGHVSIVSTEYYLPFVADLAAAASHRFERRYGTLVQALCDGGAS